MRRLRLLALLAAAAFVAGACGSSTSTATSTSAGAPSTSVATGSSTTSAGSTTVPDGFGTGTASGTALESAATSLLVRLSVARNAGFDRIVFEFQGPGLPGYEVKYIQPPLRQDASGNEVKVAGTAFLNVRLAHASGFDLDHGTPSYQGPEAITKSQVGTVVIEEVHRLGDFEGVLTWVAGLSRQAPFRVSTASSPSRLIVDVGNGS